MYAFVRDVRLIFHNCLIFNTSPECRPLRSMATTLSGAFEEWLATVLDSQRVRAGLPMIKRKAAGKRGRFEHLLNDEDDDDDDDDGGVADAASRSGRGKPPPQKKVSSAVCVCGCGLLIQLTCACPFVNAAGVNLMQCPSTASCRSRSCTTTSVACGEWWKGEEVVCGRCSRRPLRCCSRGGGVGAV